MKKETGGGLGYVCFCMKARGRVFLFELGEVREFKLTKGDVTEGTKRTGGGNKPLESSLPPDTPNLAWHG